MATRLYFPATTAADVSPAFHGDWAYNSEMVRRRLEHTKGSSSIAAGSQIGPWDENVGLAGDRQYVSHPLNGAQSISGTVKMQLMVRQHGALDVEQLLLALYVVTNDGSTVRGNLVSGVQNLGPTSGFINNASYRNKTGASSGTGISTVSAQSGDRIVVEIGYNNGFALTDNPEASAKYGENATDLPEDETQTSDGAGWIEFSTTLSFTGGGGGGDPSGVYAIRHRLSGTDTDTLVTLGATDAIVRGSVFQPTNLAQVQAMEMGGVKTSQSATPSKNIQIEDIWINCEYLDIAAPGGTKVDLKQFKKHRFGGGGFGG